MTPEELLDDARAVNEKLLKAYLQLVVEYTDLHTAVKAAVPVFNGHMNTLREALGQPKAS